MKSYTDIDLMLNKLQQVRLDPLIDDPALEDLAEGRIWYNRTEDVFKYFDGKEIQILAGGHYFNTGDIDNLWNGNLDPEYHNMLIQGPELYYLITEKIQGSIGEVEDQVAANKEELDQAIEEVQGSLEETDEKASEALEGVEQLQDALQDLSDSMVELIPVSAADYDDAGNLVTIYSDTAKMEEIVPVQNKVYLVPAVDERDQNVYNEYTWTPANGFELIGSLSIDSLELNEIDDIWNECFN